MSYIVFYEVYKTGERMLCVEKISTIELKRRALADNSEVYIVGTYPTKARAVEKYNTLLELQRERISIPNLTNQLSESLKREREREHESRLKHNREHGFAKLDTYTPPPEPPTKIKYEDRSIKRRFVPPASQPEPKRKVGRLFTPPQI